MFRVVEDDMPPLPEHCSPLLQGLLQRPSADLLCEHPWLKKNSGAHKALRPQDSIPFLRRVSADMQKSEAVRFLAPISEMPDSSEAEESVSDSPLGRRVSSSRPMDRDISPLVQITYTRDHSFVKTTFSKLCLLDVKRSAVFCDQCRLIAHSRCAINAPPTCDLRAQLLLYAQYANKGNSMSAYSNPLDVVSKTGHGHSHPMSPASEVALVTRRTSLNGTAPAPPSYGTPVTPPTAFNFMTASKRSRSNLTPEPNFASSSNSVRPSSVREEHQHNCQFGQHAERPEPLESSQSQVFG
ncbi:hypothetical protein DFH08DRAFT_920898 [Mycena albidolilacea]|uniref:Phorbol-ester/DAG-type domain-containing protein n=1 Tax=Mycena albidolilacea TaxID=1033008 RepID=A0AAD7F3B8_9AGAR|nr:hypothetical protein DFH08DRAFT_920898 [Mycena albidolilacea]